jgi:hypothetical protein
VGVLEAFVEDFLLGGRVAVVLHAQGVDLVGEAVEGGGGRGSLPAVQMQVHSTRV